ncbi:MAG TPA: VTT domain-containing protein [Planctomycetota bacterium]
MTSTSAAPTQPVARPEARPSTRRWEILRVVLVVAALLLLAGAWKWTPLSEVVRPSRLSEWFGPYRTAWYALPVTVAAFVVLGFLMVPVMGMVLACGLIFGPWLGTLYALPGSLSSAVAGYLAGRKIGRRTLERVLGRRVRALGDRIAGDGAIAVYLIRKIPAPFTLVNMVVGASGIRFVDFLAGTVLGMSPLVIVFSVGGAKLPELMEDPSPRMILLMAALLLIPLPIALAVDAALKRRRRRS